MPGPDAAGLCLIHESTDVLKDVTRTMVMACPCGDVLRLYQPHMACRCGAAHVHRLEVRHAGDGAGADQVGGADKLGLIKR